MARNHISSKIINSWWLRRLLLGILIFSLITVFALYMVPSSALRPFIHTHIDTEKAFSAGEFFLEPVSFSVTTKDGIELKGEEFRAERAKGVVILTSGLYNPVSTSLFGHAKLLYDNDYSVIIYESRAHNESEGKLIGHGITETNDLDALIEYVRTFTTYLNLPIYLMGWNTGAAASINTAAENPYVRSEDPGPSDRRYGRRIHFFKGIRKTRRRRGEKRFSVDQGRGLSLCNGVFHQSGKGS